MDKRILIGKRLEPDRKTTLNLLQMKEGRVGYERVLAFYEKNRIRVRSALLPKAVAGIRREMCLRSLTTEDIQEKTNPCDVLFVLMTLGQAASDLVDANMEAHAYAEGLYLNAMIDSCMFAFESQLLPQIRAMAIEEGYGICRQLRIPAELPDGTVSGIADELQAEQVLGLTVVPSSGMLLPVKSMCLAFRLTTDTAQMHLEHDCQTCEAKDCVLRKN